jgi:hypothetical protein
MEQIKIVRLKTGEDLIGFVVEDDYATCYIKDAFCILMEEDTRRQKQVLTLASWAPSSIIKVNECKICDNDILTKFEPTDIFVEHYLGTLKAVLNMAKAKEEVDKLTDDEIVSMIEAMDDETERTLH